MKKRYNIFQLISRKIDLIGQSLFENTYKEQYELQNIQLDKQKLRIEVLRRKVRKLEQEKEELQKRIDQYETSNTKRKVGN